jgi:uncharacterized membrane protein
VPALALHALLAVALCAPVATVRRRGARAAVLLALLPAILTAVAAALSLETAWGRRTVYGDWDMTNAGGLLLQAVILLVFGAFGLAVAGAWRFARRRSPSGR